MRASTARRPRPSLDRVGATFKLTAITDETMPPLFTIMRRILRAGLVSSTGKLERWQRKSGMR